MINSQWTNYFGTILLFVILTFSELISAKEFTYRELAKDGIVSGFRAKNGHPLKLLNQIRPIDNPQYVKVKKNLYLKKELCIGTLTAQGWRFSPLAILNHREVINHGRNIALCFCPLAGLALAVDGEMGVSGLLKYDAFLLYANETKDLILPYAQKIYIKETDVPFGPIQLLTYEGILAYFPDALILDKIYPMGNPYRTYDSSRRQGVGHTKPGLKFQYKSSKIGFHPKERVLIIGFEGRMDKAYPFSELKKAVGVNGGWFEDIVNDRSVFIYYEPKYQWAKAEDKGGHSLNVAYSYIFSLYQHRPEIPIYRYN